MDFIGGIAGMNFKPIAGYNNYLKNSEAFKIDESSSEFENVLNQRQAVAQNPVQTSGIEYNVNYNDIAAQSSQAVDASSPTSSFVKSFSNSLGGGLNSVNSNVDAANKAQEAFATGQDVSVHDVMIAAEKASLSLNMAMQLRNKMVNAYNEINQIRV